MRLYKYLSLKNVPSARNIKLIKQSAKKLVQQTQLGHNP